MIDPPKQYSKLFKRATTNATRSVSIRCFCLQCVGWDRDEVKSCSSKDCPLWRFRFGKEEK